MDLVFLLVKHKYNAWNFLFFSRDPRGIHSLITRTTAKERYLLNDVDLDVREPALRRIYKKNPRDSSWGDMQLFLEAQVGLF